ncbi:sigma factor, partial [Acinetobacter baumannii]
MPNLQRYACKLTRDANAAEDLLQDCLARALSRQHRFEPGTNMQA